MFDGELAAVVGLSTGGRGHDVVGVDADPCQKLFGLRRRGVAEVDGLTREGRRTERGRSYPGGAGRCRFTFCGSWISGTPLGPEGT